MYVQLLISCELSNMFESPQKLYAEPFSKGVDKNTKHKTAKNKMTIITKQRNLQKSELLETNGGLTSEYTVSKIMIRKQRIITKQRKSIGTSRKTAN